MAKIEKSIESGPQLFFDFTWKYVPRLFLVAPWAEKMTISQKTGRVWFEDTYFLNPWCLPVNLPYWSPLVTSLKLFYTSRPMWKGMTSDNWMLNVSGFWFAFVTLSTLWAYFRQVFNLNRHSVFKAQIVLIHLTIENMISEFGMRYIICKLCWDNILSFPSPHCVLVLGSPQPTWHLMLSPTLDNDLICCLLIRPWHRMGQYLLCHFLHL